MDPDRYQQTVQALAGALKSLRLYPAGHPAVERQVQNLLDGLLQLLGRENSLRMGLMEGSLFLGDHLFVQPGPAVEGLMRALENLEVEGLEFYPGLNGEELKKFLPVLLQAKARKGPLDEWLQDQDIHHIAPLQIEKDEPEETEEQPRKIYGRALKVVDQIFRDVRMGKIPSSAEAKAVVGSMARMTLQEPHALFAMSMLKDYDNYTFTHSVNVSVIALAVGRACELPEESLRVLGLGGLLHDLGKLKIDREIINKPGRLTSAEFEKIKHHPRSGADLVTAMEDIAPEAVDIVLGHHLRYDREGYPADARGKKLSPMVDMAAIADTYDAITTLRSYQRPMTPRKAVNRLLELSGSVLHPDYVKRFVDSLGTYPVGSLVRLDSNEIGLVVWVDTSDPDSVRLKIIFDADGNRLPKPPEKDLFGRDAGRIIGEVNPFAKGVEVAEYFD